MNSHVAFPSISPLMFLQSTESHGFISLARVNAEHILMQNCLELISWPWTSLGVITMPLGNPGAAVALPESHTPEVSSGTSTDGWRSVCLTHCVNSSQETSLGAWHVPWQHKDVQRMH